MVSYSNELDQTAPSSLLGVKTAFLIHWKARIKSLPGYREHPGWLSRPGCFRWAREKCRQRQRVGQRLASGQGGSRMEATGQKDMPALEGVIRGTLGTDLA